MEIPLQIRRWKDSWSWTNHGFAHSASSSCYYYCSSSSSSSSSSSPSTGPLTSISLCLITVSRYVLTSSFFSSYAQSLAVYPFLLFLPKSAPPSTKTLTLSTEPSLAATCKAILWSRREAPRGSLSLPSYSSSFTSLPLSSSNCISGRASASLSRTTAAYRALVCLRTSPRLSRREAVVAEGAFRRGAPGSEGSPLTGAP